MDFCSKHHARASSFGCYDILFGKVKEFIYSHLFKTEVNLDDKNVLRNLSEIEVTKTIIQTFKNEINALTVKDVGDTEIKNYIKVSSSRPLSSMTVRI